MPNQPPILVQSVSKRFHRGERCDSLYSLVARRLARPAEFRRRREASEFWALRDVSLEVGRGECVGVIGHNGAGKSTLLKLLAGLMRPEEGSIEIRGRVSALIEVGAGFQPALTGRENVFLNASILGIPCGEARRLFDDIVEFAGVGEHIDMPVKHYSSGMHARLGFAIAVHARPEVLLVDEVLSVGDAQFRTRCLERMNVFLREGVAIVFVSHDLDTVQRFCHRTLVLAEGRPDYLGDSAEAIGRYHRSYSRTVCLTDVNGEPLASLKEVRCACAHAGSVEQANSLFHSSRLKAAAGERISIEYSIEFRADVDHPSFGLSITRLSDRLTVYETSSTRQGFEAEPIRAGESRRVRCSFEMNVAPGEYAVGIHVRDRDSLLYLIEEVEAAAISVLGPREGLCPAHVAPTCKVETASRVRLTQDCPKSLEFLPTAR